MPVLPYDKACCAAIVYVKHFGLSVIPIGEEKRPCVKWKEFQGRRPTFEEILSWPKEGYNLAVVTGRVSKGLVIVDCESREDAEWFWRNKGQSPVVVETKRGFHFYFQSSSLEIRCSQKCFDKYDVRGEGGYALAPPSLHSNGEYLWRHKLVDVLDLPEFNVDWRPYNRELFDDKKIRDGAAYISKIFAVSGQGGHDETYKCVCYLQESGLDETEALAVISDWNNTNAKPPWSMKELLHKVKSVYH